MNIGDELQTFIHCLANERPTNVGIKKHELVKIREKIRKTKAKDRKQKQRMKKMMAALRATSSELVFLKSEAVRVHNEIQALDDNIAD